MFQIIIALIVISFFVLRTFVQRKKGKISNKEFIFWITFWFSSALLIIFIRKIDSFVAGLGFSSSGIDVMVYLSIVFIFYLILKLIVKVEKIEKNITEIVRQYSINNKK